MLQRGTPLVLQNYLGFSFLSSSSAAPLCLLCFGNSTLQGERVKRVRKYYGILIETKDPNLPTVLGGQTDLICDPNCSVLCRVPIAVLASSSVVYSTKA